MSMVLVFTVASLTESEVSTLLTVVVVTPSRDGVVALIAYKPHVVAFISHLSVNVIVNFILEGLIQLSLIVFINIFLRHLFKGTVFTAIVNLNLIFQQTLIELLRLLGVLGFGVTLVLIIFSTEGGVHVLVVKRRDEVSL